MEQLELPLTAGGDGMTTWRKIVWQCLNNLNTHIYDPAYPLVDVYPKGPPHKDLHNHVYSSFILTAPKVKTTEMSAKT